ncbi:hypothetical protein HC931_11090 [Candidatus Gracilibacteria bacterium]|nr:hypothetical protein [Candidatus Gracilibacteria bacterium]NJM86227.1 hypothetical protein [Hydrococcus sp. RU_2_2]NJP17718.1 hypothetical protein [Hydrococcus sp. CRU_1_1]
MSYFLGSAPSGLPIGTALYCNTINYSVGTNDNIVVEVSPIQLVAIIPDVSDLSLNGGYFTFI